MVNSALSTTPGISHFLFFDCGCCNHMASEFVVFTSNISPVKTSSVHIADNSKLKASHIGDIINCKYISIRHILVPKLTLNLISVGQLYELGYGVNFSQHGCIVQEPQTAHVIGTGSRVGHSVQACLSNNTI